MNPKISVIIPVYNVEKYLDECVNSVLAQNFQDYEIILVNDGSTDNSGKICDAYAEKYSQIKVVHKENGGLSDARNFGIKNAHGKYLMFLDSDDFWDGNNHLFNISKIIEKDYPDLILYGLTFYYGDKFTIPFDFTKYKFTNNSFIEQSKYLIIDNKYGFYACNKIVKRNIILDNNLFFIKDRLGEDMPWNYELVNYIKFFSIYQSNFYFYRQNREGQITKKIREKNIRDIELVLNENLSQLTKQDILYDFKFQYLFYTYQCLLYCFFKMNKNDIRKLTTEFQNKIFSWDKMFMEVYKNNSTNFIRRIKYIFIKSFSSYYYYYLFNKINFIYQKIKIH